MMLRANGRQKETAVRLALGSSRGRLIRQSMIESLMLSAAGATLAAWIARWGVTGLIASLPAGSLARLEELGFHKTALAFTELIASATGIFWRSAPARRPFRTQFQSALKSRARACTKS